MNNAGEIQKVYVTFSPEQGLVLAENDKHICNFEPWVVSRVTRYDDGESCSYVRFFIEFADGTRSEEFVLPTENLENVDWHSLNPKCLLNPDFSKASHHLAYIIRSALFTATEETQYRIGRLGTHIINGSPAFCVGDRLIWSSTEQETDIALEQLPYKLAIDPQLTEEDAVAGMMKIVKLSPDAGRPIFSHSLLNVMRQVYIDMGVTPCSIIFVVGETGMKKTTYTAFQTQLYNRDKGIQEPVRLNATIAAAETIISENSDCSVVLDDLFPAASSATKRKQEQTLEALTRIVGDKSGRARMQGNEVVTKEPRSGVIVTGEYIIGTGSTAARLLPVRVTTPIDNMKLSECQNEPLVLSTFYNYYISWYITNYFEIKDLLAKWIIESRKVHLGVHARLQETYFCLESAYKLFLQYCVDKGFTSKEKVQEQAYSFGNLLMSLVKAQDKRVRQGGGSEDEKPNYLKLIRTMYNGGSFHLADSAEKLKDKHDGLLYYNCLCLRGTKLVEKIKKFVPAATLRDIVNALLAKNALKLVNEKHTVQICGCGGKRFYAIKLKELK